MSEFSNRSSSFSNIMDHWNHTTDENDLFKLTHMRTQAVEEDLYIVDPTLEPGSQELIDAYDKYMSMTKPFRRKADWLTLDVLGLTNQQIFDYLYNVSMKNDWNADRDAYNSYQNIDESAPVDIPNDFVPVMDKPVDFESLTAQFTGPEWNMRIEQLSDWSAETGYMAINPAQAVTLGMLEEMWAAWNNMIRRHQRYSDWKTIELFGLTNQQLYVSLKNYFIKCEKESGEPLTPEGVIVSERFITKQYMNKVVSNDDMTFKESGEISEILSKTQTEYFDKRYFTHAIKEAADIHDSIFNNVPSAQWFHSDLPAYTPDEMIDMGVYAGDTNPELINDGDLIPGQIMNEDWFREFCSFWETGYETEEYVKANLDRIHRLEQLYMIPSEKKGTKSWKESVTALGWNPNIDFNPENRVSNDNIQSTHFKSIIDHYNFFDVRDLDTGIDFIQEDTKNAEIKPIFVTLIEGNSPLTSAIKKFTNADYSHAMLSLDSSMEKMYSFGVDPKVKLTGSFIIDDIRQKEKNRKFKVYAIFVNNKTYDQIKKNIEHFLQKQRSTNFSWDGLVKYLFQQPYETNDEKMFCSQFVDHMLKLGNIDFTKKQSSLLSPNDLDKAAKGNKKIYTVYKGNVGGYKKERIDNIIDTLFKRAKYFESALLEARELPIQANKQGDIFIRTPLINYENEYAASHKLLMEYDKVNNYEGMKAELAKLWAMLLVIEEKLYGNHMIPSNRRKALFTVRARILGDFKKYMEIVQRNDAKFDFNQYFEKSPYSNTVYKINAGTIAGLIKTVKEVL